jgi:hypothetical protein
VNPAGVSGDVADAIQAGTVFIGADVVLPESLSLQSPSDASGWKSLERAGCSAFERISASVKSQKCNSLQISRVENKSFLKAPSVSVRAHSRHPQELPSFGGQ